MPVLLGLVVLCAGLVVLGFLDADASHWLMAVALVANRRSAGAPVHPIPATAVGHAPRRIAVPADALREKVKGLMPQARRDLAEMVAFKSVHDPAQFPPEECAGMVDWLLEAFSAVGLQDVRGYETPDGSKAVCGHAPGPPGAPTVLLYFHHDVQPRWTPRRGPRPVWELTERDGRWYGRGAADCKGNIAVHLTALRALGGDLPVSIKIVGEGSEEQGTGGLEAFVPEHADLLAADAILVCDTGNLAVGVPTLTTSCADSPTSSSRWRRWPARCTRGCTGARHRRPRRPDPHAGDPARRARQHDRPRPRRGPDLGRCRLPRRAVPHGRERARRGRPRR